MKPQQAAGTSTASYGTNMVGGWALPMDAHTVHASTTSARCTHSRVVGNIYAMSPPKILTIANKIRSSKSWG